MKAVVVSVVVVTVATASSLAESNEAVSNKVSLMKP